MTDELFQLKCTHLLPLCFSALEPFYRHEEPLFINITNGGLVDPAYKENVQI